MSDVCKRLPTATKPNNHDKYRVKKVAELTAADVARTIPDNATIALTGSGVFLEADTLFEAIEALFLETGHPRDLTLVHALGIGDGKRSGLTRFAHEGMVRRVIGGHWSWSPAMQALAADNKVAAYSFPGGIVSALLRESGAGRPGVITKVGLGTFADPRLDGARCNEAATETLVELVELDSCEYLRYKPLSVDIALIRATEADPHGNLTLRREPTDLDIYAVALAAHGCNGRVFAQVESIRSDRILPSRLARVPGVMVEGIVVAPHARKTYLPDYEPRIVGEPAATEGGTDESGTNTTTELPTGVRRIIAERAAQELQPGASVNFGFGIPGGIPALVQQNNGPAYWSSVEQGIHNGQLLDGPMFGAAWDPDSIVASLDQFDFYSGGGIDIAFLGMGELDAQGNVNVSMIGDRLVGPGGFVDITQTAAKVVFCGTFEAKGLRVEIADDGKMNIQRYGDVAKLVAAVRHVTFSGPQARRNGQQVLYVTERAVFQLGESGLDLIEVADGADLHRDVLERMAFIPRVAL